MTTSPRHFAFWPPNVPKHLTLPETSVWYNAEVSARRFPKKTCIAFYDGTITFEEFRDQAERLAGFLQTRCGVKRGDRVGLYLQNSPQFVLGYYAILRADAMVVPINPMLLTAELAHIVGDSGAKVVIAGQELFGRLEPLLGKGIDRAIIACYSDFIGARTDLAVPDWVAASRQAISGAGVTLWSDALAAGATPGPHLAGPDDLCVLPYTSGTTGHPKGCVHRHRQVMHTAIAVPQWNRVYQDETALAVLPF